MPRASRSNGRTITPGNPTITTTTTTTNTPSTATTTTTITITTTTTTTTTAAAVAGGRLCNTARVRQRDGERSEQRQRDVNECPPDYVEDINLEPDVHHLVPPIGRNNRIIVPEVLPRLQERKLAPFTVIEPLKGEEKIAAMAWLFRQEQRIKDVVAARGPNVKMPPPNRHMLIRVVQAGWGRLAATPCDRCVTEGGLCVIINKPRQKACWRCGKHGCSHARNAKVVADIHVQAAANASRDA